MTVRMVRSTIKAEHVTDVEAAFARVVVALEETQTKGVRYAVSRIDGDPGDGGVTFVALVHLDDGVDDPLPALPAFTEFQDGLQRWHAVPPTVEQLTVVGSYQLF